MNNKVAVLIVALVLIVGGFLLFRGKSQAPTEVMDDGSMMASSTEEVMEGDAMMSTTTDDTMTSSSTSTSKADAK